MASQESTTETRLIKQPDALPEEVRVLAQHDVGELATEAEVQASLISHEAEKLAAEIEEEWAQPSRYYRD